MLSEANFDNSSAASTIYLLYAIFAFQSSYLISAQPWILGRLRSRSTIEGQNTARYHGIGKVPLMGSPILPTLGRDVPKVKRNTGSHCFDHGSRTSRDQIDPLIDTVCTDLISRSLTWEHVDNDQDQYKNPMVTYNASLNGDTLRNIDHHTQNLTFVLYDQNGGNGGEADKYMTKDYCKKGYQKFLDFCVQQQGGSTKGGLWCSEDGLVAYSVSWRVPLSLSGLDEHAVCCAA